MKMRTDCIVLFNCMLSPAMILLNEQLTNELSEIQSDYNSRNALYSSAVIVEQCNAISNAITSSFQSVITEFFNFLNNEYISPKRLDIEKIAEIICTKIIDISKCYFNCISEVGVPMAVSIKNSSTLGAMSRLGSSYIMKYYESECLKSSVLRKSNSIIQTKTAFWFGLFGLLASVAAIVISLL